MFDREKNRFGTKVKGRVYDITGEVTANCNWVSWLEIEDDTYKERVVRDYIMN